MKNDLKYYLNCIIKRYPPEAEFNNMSSLDNELFTLEKFSSGGKNPYCPKVFRIDNTTYAIERYSFNLGEHISINKNNVKRMFFTISYEEFERQIDEILSWLKNTSLNHRDINPSNLIFYEKEKLIKLIDFYWTKTFGITVGTPGQLNWFYKQDDFNAFKQIKDQIKVVWEDLRKSSDNEINDIINSIGSEKYYDGSSAQQGMTYHPITIPGISNKFHVDSSKLVKNVIENISIYPESAIDVGAAVGNFTFDLIRNFDLKKIYAYESDPHVNKFLKKIKSTYFLNELEVMDTVDINTDFPEVDISLMLNVHMWIHKQVGREGCDKITSNLIKKSKLLFFQTCGSESPGQYIIKDKEFTSKEEIEKYLYSLGAKKVYYIGQEPIHGSFRHLFKIEGK